MVDFNCRAEIDLSPRGGLSCAREPLLTLRFFPPPLVVPSRPLPPFRRPSTSVETRRGGAFSRYGNTYRYYATSLAKSPKSSMKSLPVRKSAGCAFLSLPLSLFLSLSRTRARVARARTLLLASDGKVVVSASFRFQRSSRGSVVSFISLAKRIKLLSRHS